MESKDKGPGEGLGGEIHRKLTHIFTSKNQDFNKMKWILCIIADIYLLKKPTLLSIFIIHK